MDYPHYHWGTPVYYHRGPGDAAGHVLYSSKAQVSSSQHRDPGFCCRWDIFACWCAATLNQIFFVQLFADDWHNCVVSVALSHVCAEILNDPSIRSIPFAEVEVGEKIGTGASGIVYRGVWNNGGENHSIALKQLSYGKENISDNFSQEFLKEIKLMRYGVVLSLADDSHELQRVVSSKHRGAHWSLLATSRGVVSHYGASQGDAVVDSHLTFPKELMERGSVRDILDQKKSNLPWSMRLKIAKDAASGLYVMRDI